MENDKNSTPKETITPDFLKDAKGNLREAEESATKLGPAEFTNAENNLASQNTPGSGSFANSVKGSGKDTAIDAAGDQGGDVAKKATMAIGASIAVVMILVVGIAILTFAIPMVVMGAIDYGLTASLGFDGKILEEQAEYIVAEQMARGHFNANLAADFEKHGVEVGQVTLAGDFVRTNNYKSELDAEVASDGMFYDHSTGELAMRFEGEIITAGDFVAKVESNPRLYAAFARATDITARFYYSKDVNRVYREFGLSRNNFASWVPTGSIQGDQEQFETIFNKIIEKVARVGLNGYDEEHSDNTEYDRCLRLATTATAKAACESKRSRTFTKSATFSDIESGEQLAKTIAGSVAGEGANDKAKSLLNTAISANEPYIAAGTFLALQEGLNRARIDGDGPVNPLLNTLSQSNTATVTNVRTGENTTTHRSVLRTPNFVAAVSNHSYSTESAEDYSRDRVNQMTGGVSAWVTNKTTMATDDNKRFNILIRMKGQGEKVKEEVLRSANSLSTVFYDDALEITKTTIGGNRIVMGGSFLSNSINSRVLGAMPSDEATVLAYQNELDKVLARRAAADRATLSPFDISSEHTFLGSLVRKFGLITMQNFASSGASAGFGAFSSVADLFSESVRDLTSNTVLADANESYLTTFGDYCSVAPTIGVVTDMYCTAHTTSDTSRMGWGLGDYLADPVLAGSIDGEGNIVKDSDLGDFIDFGSGRETTVGIEDAMVCDAYKSKRGGVMGKVSSLLNNILDLHDACETAIEVPLFGTIELFSVPENVATGAMYTLSSQNATNDMIRLFTSYILYNTVASILNEKESAVSVYREKYYAEHPQDNSAAGIIARRSGMSKEEAQIALNYAEYLDYIARYQPEMRYAFALPEFDYIEDDLLFENKRLQEELAILIREIFYRDLRNLTTFSV